MHKKVVLAVALVIFVITASMALYIYTQHQRNSYRPTGDALFDEFAESALKQMPRYSELEETYYKRFEIFRPAVYNSTVLIESMEPKWGQDPRYWQLSWLLGRSQSASTPRDKQTEDVARAMTLEIVDENSVAAIHYPSLHAVNPDAAYALIEAAEEDDENAYYHYIHATLLAADSKFDEAIFQIERGNVARRFDAPCVFPLNLLDNPAMYQTCENKAIAGYILRLTDERQGRDFFLPLESALTAIVEAKAEALTAPQLDELLTCAVRQGKREDLAIGNLFHCWVIIDQLTFCIDKYANPELVDPELITKLRAFKHDVLHAATHGRYCDRSPYPLSEYNIALQIMDEQQMAQQVVVNIQPQLDAFLDRPFSKYAEQKELAARDT